MQCGLVRRDVRQRTDAVPRRDRRGIDIGVGGCTAAHLDPGYASIRTHHPELDQQLTHARVRQRIGKSLQQVAVAGM